MPSAAAAGILALAVLHPLTSDGLSTSLQQLTDDAVSGDPAVSSPAIARLRAEGPEGLDALFKAHTSTIDKLRHGASCVDATREARDAWKRLQKVALDRVSAQHDCSASRLYWALHGSLIRPKPAARAVGKPILSLRMLGRPR